MSLGRYETRRARPESLLGMPFRLVVEHRDGRVGGRHAEGVIQSLTELLRRDEVLVGHGRHNEHRLLIFVQAGYQLAPRQRVTRGCSGLQDTLSQGHDRRVTPAPRQLLRSSPRNVL